MCAVKTHETVVNLFSPLTPETNIRLLPSHAAAVCVRLLFSAEQAEPRSIWIWVCVLEADVCVSYWRLVNIRVAELAATAASVISTISTFCEVQEFAAVSTFRNEKPLNVFQNLFSNPDQPVLVLKPNQNISTVLPWPESENMPHKEMWSFMSAFWRNVHLYDDLH